MFLEFAQQHVTHVQQAYTLGKTKQQAMPIAPIQLRGEKNLLDPEVEIKGVRDILAALTDEEKSELADANMPLRHFRAEKVASSRERSPSGSILTPTSPGFHRKSHCQDQGNVEVEKGVWSVQDCELL